MLTTATYSIFERAELIASALILLTSFVLFTQSRIHSMVNTFVCQSALLAIVTVLQAMLTQRKELYLSAAIIIVLKVLFIPYAIRYTVKKLNIRHSVSIIKYPFLLLMGAIGVVLFCYHIIAPLRDTAQLAFSSNTAIAMAVTLLGMLLLITHHKAISHIIGFMAMENGIFFAALSAAHGMPMIVELGVAFDVLVAAILFGIFFFHIRSSIDSLNVDRLNALREDVEN